MHESSTSVFSSQAIYGKGRILSGRLQDYSRQQEQTNTTSFDLETVPLLSSIFSGSALHSLLFDFLSLRGNRNDIHFTLLPESCFLALFHSEPTCCTSTMAAISANR
ncbi:hypothetical protein QQG55_31930 [Brugia pahangi]